MGRLAEAIQMLYGATAGGPYAEPPFFPWEGALYLYVDDAPCTLREQLYRWLDVQPDLLDASPECSILLGPRGYAITEARWNRFLAWAKDVLTRELDESCYDSNTPTGNQRSQTVTR